MNASSSWLYLFFFVNQLIKISASLNYYDFQDKPIYAGAFYDSDGQCVAELSTSRTHHLSSEQIATFVSYFIRLNFTTALMESCSTSFAAGNTNEIERIFCHDGVLSRNGMLTLIYHNSLNGTKLNEFIDNTVNSDCGIDFVGWIFLTIFGVGFYGSLISLFNQYMEQACGVNRHNELQEEGHNAVPVI